MLALWGFALARSAPALPGNCTQVQRTVTCTFGYTGAEQTLAVPAGVSSAQVSAVGAAGGGIVGGVGGTASETVALTPASTLYVEVGGTGGSIGGFNGGGAPGTGASTGGAGGGGGASDVRTVPCGGACPGDAASLGSRLIVAAGGGGSGAPGAQANAFAAGGGAGSAGSVGRNASGGDHGGGGGGPGTVSAGGAKGSGGTPNTGGTPGTDGTIGSPGVGGTGGGGSASAVGGGAGGGYFGGGGGGGGADSPADQAAGGGGGGGASFAPAGSTGVADSTTAPASVAITYTLPDTTRPTISITTPAANAGYPGGTTVAASYSCGDEPGGSGLAGCHGPVPSGSAIDTSTPGVHSFTVTAADNAGNAASQTVDYVVFAAPSASVTAPGSGGVYARGQVIPTRFGCAEGVAGPGLVQCQDSNGASASPGVAPSKSATGQLNTATLGPHTYTVAADSADGLTGRSQIDYTVAAAPSISIISPAGARKYGYAQSVPARYSCKDGAYGPGIKSCSGTVRSGSPSYTRTLGPVKFTVTAISKDGQTTSKTVTYSVSVSVKSAPRYYVSLGGQPIFLASQLLAFHNPRSVCNVRHGGLHSCGQKLASVTLLGVAADLKTLLAWRLAVGNNPTALRTAILAIVAPSKRTVTYQLKNAWPSKVTYTQVRAGHSNVMFATVTLEAQSVTLEG